jgi:hypothetical protein
MEVKKKCQQALFALRIYALLQIRLQEEENIWQVYQPNSHCRGSH